MGIIYQHLLLMLVKAKSRKLKNMLEIQGVCNNIMPDPIVEKSPKRAYNEFWKLRKFEVGENNSADEKVDNVA